MVRRFRVSADSRGPEGGGDGALRPLEASPSRNTRTRRRSSEGAAPGQPALNITDCGGLPKMAFCPGPRLSTDDWQEASR
ncbi:hypothetical protein GCM10010357_37880 [Streptomyces luteireticuli]|uniref:Uncharacterized protein n=1 Tax=Streptomyces luteireticuli TaxID=173858 RepID=A0ABP3IP97_9ACTN